MKIAVYWGCKIPTSQFAYEMSIRQVLSHFNIVIHDLDGASCCGGPIRNVNSSAATYLSLRNLAIAHKSNFDQLLVPCNECHFMISEAKYHVDNDKVTFHRVQELLKEEDLEYSSDTKIWHTVDLLHDFIGLDEIAASLKRKMKDFRLAAHSGCQILRPSEIGRVDNSEKPRKLENLIKILGAEIIKYSEELDCCGSALLNTHTDTALSLAGSKLKALQTYEVDGLVDTCPYCHTMYDLKQKEALNIVGGKPFIPTFYYTQLLGIALGIDPMELGLHLNQSVDAKTLSKLASL